MIKTFTQNDVVRYIYNETSAKEEADIAQAILCDSELQIAYKELVGIKRQLTLESMEPAIETVNAVLEYSRTEV